MHSLKRSIDSKFNDLRLAIKEDRGRWVSSQGANALIVTYPPEKEDEFLTRAKNDYAPEHIINVADLFIDLIDSFGPDIDGNKGFEVFKKTFKDYRSEPERIFNNKGEQLDLYEMITTEIDKAVEKEKVPILIRTGILYGTEISITKLVEHSTLNSAKYPLIVFYPAKIKENIDGEEKIYFLGVRRAGDYRGQLI